MKVLHDIYKKLQTYYNKNNYKINIKNYFL